MSTIYGNMVGGAFSVKTDHTLTKEGKPADAKVVGDKITKLKEEIEPTTDSIVYGFHVNSNESDPSEAVTYLRDAVGMTPAKMDFTSGIFNWGSWKDAFFIPRPCMLNYDGTVAYYLDPNDYSKKYEDGTPSDISNVDFGGNAMMEWGKDHKRIWYKIVPDDLDDTSYSVYIADHKEDEDFHCYNFYNKNN